MRFVETGLPGVVRVVPDPHRDARGSFARLHCTEAFADARIDGFAPVQTDLSRNLARHTLRGMHWQAAPWAQAKLVRAVRGAVWDVAVDLRPDSPNALRWVAARLDTEQGEALFIPAGFAHGFLTLEPDTDVLYLQGTPYAPESARGARWDDPAFAIDWPARPVAISERDRSYPDYTA